MSRVRVRPVRQFLMTECGLCCAAMVMSAYGAPRQIASLRKEVVIGRDGLTLAGVAAALRSRGMQTRVYRAAQHAVPAVTLPAIAYWDAQHMVVVERVHRGSWTIVDPSSGRSTLSEAEVAQHYSGIVVEATPGPDFVAEPGRPSGIWKTLWAMCAGARRPFAAVLGLSLLSYLLMIALPLATEQVVDLATASSEPDALAPIFVGVAVAAVLYLLLSLARSLIASTVVARIGLALGSTTFGKLLRLPYAFFAARSNGELMYRLTSLAGIRDLLSGQLTSALLDVGALVIVTVFAFVREPTLGVVVLVLIIVMAGLTVTGAKASRRITDEEISANGVATGMQIEAVGAIDVLRVAGVSGSFFAEWRGHFGRAIALLAQRMRLQGAISTATSTIQVFGPFAVLAVGVSLADSGIVGLGAAVALQALTATALGAVQSLSTSAMQVAQMGVYVERLADILDQPDDAVFGDERAELDGSVEFVDASFSYPGAATEALRGVSFRVEPGERVAVVGPTGSGKTTLAQMLVGLHAPTAGEVRIGGRALRDVSPESLQQILAWVPQDVRLSSRSVAKNIDFGAEDPRMEEVVRAARAAALAPTVEAMPLGYHTHVGDLGGGLSGGQKQRVALARALVRSPRLLVLDEATSALDTITESLIVDALESLECTQIIIAHRLSTIARADRVIVVDEGRIVQQGTHDELIAREGTYRDLVHAQVEVRA